MKKHVSSSYLSSMRHGLPTPGLGHGSVGSGWTASDVTSPCLCCDSRALCSPRSKGQIRVSASDASEVKLRGGLALVDCRLDQGLQRAEKPRQGDELGECEYGYGEDSIVLKTGYLVENENEVAKVRKGAVRSWS